MAAYSVWYLVQLVESNCVLSSEAPRSCGFCLKSRALAPERLPTTMAFGIQLKLVQFGLNTNRSGVGRIRDVGTQCIIQNQRCL